MFSSVIRWYYTYQFSLCGLSDQQSDFPTDSQVAFLVSVLETGTIHIAHIRTLKFLSLWNGLGPSASLERFYCVMGSGLETWRSSEEGRR